MSLMCHNQKKISRTLEEGYSYLNVMT